MLSPRRKTTSENWLVDGVLVTGCTVQKDSHRVRVVRYNGFGNDAMRKTKIYIDTVVQIAMQLSFLKTHGRYFVPTAQPKSTFRFAPIYETASTRKFYHGRTETIRGCTQEMVAFGRAVMSGAAVKSFSSSVVKFSVKETELLKLFKAAYDAHNDFMAMAMEGKGIDRHLLGLRLTLEEFNKGCSPKQKVPEFMEDEVWKLTGGGGNFLLSTRSVNQKNNATSLLQLYRIHDGQ